MTVHLLKTAVGVSDVASLAARQDGRSASRDGQTVVFGYTRRWPKRLNELVDGGSIFWIIRRAIRVRQRLLGFEEAVDGDGNPFCRMILDQDLVATEPFPRRPIQGWRYLTVEDAPRDSRERGEEDDILPAHIAAEMGELGLL